MMNDKTRKVPGLKFDRTIKQHRARLRTVNPKGMPADVLQEYVSISLKGDVHIPLRIYRPKHVTPPYPTILYIPGTAFVASEFAFTELICTHIAEKSNCQVIVINSRLAPEYQFPTGLNDADILLHAIINAPYALLRMDKSKIAIVGYSSGGNFAASIASKGAEEGLPIARQILISPFVDLSRSLKNFKNEEDQDVSISDDFVTWFLNLYLPEGINLKEPSLSPFWKKLKNINKFPPTDIIFGEFDRLRGDAEAYFQKLLKKGVNTYRLMIQGGNHSDLWYKLEIVYAICARVKETFNLRSIPKSIPTVAQDRLNYLAYLKDFGDKRSSSNSRSR